MFARHVAGDSMDAAQFWRRTGTWIEAAVLKLHCMVPHYEPPLSLHALRFVLAKVHPLASPTKTIDQIIELFCHIFEVRWTELGTGSSSGAKSFHQTGGDFFVRQSV
jgi:hypothetical protein